MTTLIPVDATEAATKWLRARHSWPVRSLATTGRHLQVYATGGDPRDYVGAVDVHQLTVTAWGESEDDIEEATTAARLALGVIRDAESIGWLGEHPCSSVEVLSLPYRDPDPSTGRARSTFTCRVHLRGVRKDH